MLVTLSGMVTLVRLLQLQNANLPMLVTLSGMVMLVRLVQSRNAESPDAGDAVGNGDARQASAAIECANTRCW